jgi:MFS superfamily sulfate permease-like transporter
LPLSKAVGSSIPITKLREKRIVAMRKTFYAYASFDEPKISKALVLSAIDTWTWYWALLELAFLFVITAAVLVCFRAFKPAVCMSISAALSSLIFLTVFRVGGQKAQYQIEEITSETGRVEEINREFAAL